MKTKMYVLGYIFGFLAVVHRSYLIYNMYPQFRTCYQFVSFSTQKDRRKSYDYSLVFVFYNLIYNKYVRVLICDNWLAHKIM